MQIDNLKIAQQYYEGWETSNKELLNVSPELKFTSPDGNFSGAKDFFDQCWQFSGVKFQNKIFLSGGENVCVKYNFPLPDGTAKPMVEWLTVKEGTITEIQVFYDKN
ncbi:MAG TPA: hypothetical protein PK605_03810 [Ignavibacteria bacterium]|nr:hypothetical protein [Bacteroidota bacterium]HRE10878.1 hypothetical protein [Ignavibacteria bacterium]HRF66113.1 hypothetical protein [Ignavibacteria bacterium]HRJ03511.1 hypothetical protein [Ignavibacteria bacterium]HRJ84095.1 hypothetical protein [Ignavibacteria bacterium]